MDCSPPPSYEQAIASSLTQPTQQHSYPKPPLGFVPADNHPNIPPSVQQHSIYGTNTQYQQQVRQDLAQPARIVYFENQILGRSETFVTCPHCHVQKMSKIEYEPSSKAHVVAALLCILGFWCCACLPYCMEGSMNVKHFCGNCNRFLGTYTSECFNR